MRFWGIFFVILMLFSATVNATPCLEWVAKAVSVQGTVEVRVAQTDSNSNKHWVTVQREDTFCANDVVRVKSNSRAALILTNDTVLRLDQNSTITFTNLSANNASKLNLSKGIAHFISRVKQAFEVVTPFVNAAVEGTEFVVAVSGNQSQVTVFEGKVRVSNTRGEVLLTKNQTALTQKDQSPLLQINLKPRDVVQWALYYPVIIDSADVTSDHRALITGAANKLALGRVEEALQDLNTIQKTVPDQTEALALKAIIAVVNNDKVHALELATQAYTSNKQNISAMLAMSYVQQAHFNIHAALTPLIQNPHSSGLVYARLSEVYLMLGELDKALVSANQAVSLNPELAKTQSILGFAYLTQIKVKQAEQVFNKAITLDQSDPLPHLGLGLALIRQGQVDEGRREIEYAASLNPNNALIRSYLGKAYYEEKRDKVATDQFNMAKDLDVNDPTAWFYSAIQKQSNNRPVEALQDLQQSVKLNDNRAVYRSRLLLDEDQAARSSGLARIYHDLGFDQLAQQQAFNSINQDFSNYSAHRFLAESYANRSRHDIGRVSELLISQLLAPINITPVAPHLSESQLGVQPNAGPGGASFNEYDPLFARNQSRLQVSALAGNNKTLGDELVYSQLINNTSLSLGQYHFETDGFRNNNDYKQDILNVFAHRAITPKQSLQFEVKKNEKKNGDLALRFDPTNFSEALRETRDETSYRLGYHNQLSQTSHLLASMIQRDTMFTRVDSKEVVPTLLLEKVDTTQDSNARTSELQYIQKQARYDFLIGVGDNRNALHDVTIKQYTLLGMGPPPPPDSSTNNKFDRNSINAYVYSHWKAFNNLTLTFGLSHNDFDDPVYATKQTNPKLGLQWEISSQSQLRLAGFRTLKRPLTGNQTIEPTQIAGFNQFYDDPFASDAKNYGLAFEHRFSKKLFTGLELTKRDLIVPISGIGTEEQTEYAHRAYVYWTPYDVVSVTAEFQYEDFDREFLPISEPQKLTTRKLPLSLKLHYPNGWSGSLTTTYFDQDVTTSSSHDKTDFWIADARLGYRLPKRLGLINLEFRNLLDKDFNFQDAAFRTGMAQPATIYHERSIWLRMALTFD